MGVRGGTPHANLYHNWMDPEIIQEQMKSLYLSIPLSIHKL